VKAVIKIAHRVFLFPNAKKAADVLAMLSDAMEMQPKHVKVGEGNSWRYIETFFPDSNPTAMSLEIVNDEQLRAIEPITEQNGHEVPGTAQPLVIIRRSPHGPMRTPKRLLLSGGDR
jgi:hypothetical protein